MAGAALLLACAPQAAAAALDVPLVGYGTANVNDAAAIVHALRSGVRLIDTAALYQNHVQVGGALRQSGVPREEVFLVTKVGFWPPSPFDFFLRRIRDRFPAVKNFLAASKGYEADSIQAALAEMDVTYLDLCLVHSPITSFSEFFAAILPHRFGRFSFLKGWPEWLGAPARRVLRGLDRVVGGSPAAKREVRLASWRALEAAKREGVCRDIGVSNYALQHLMELDSSAAVQPVVNEIEAHPRYYPVGVLAFCRQRGVHVIGYGNGVSLEDARGVVAAVAARHSRTPSQVTLRWATQQNITVLPRSSNIDRISENARISDFSLSSEDMAQLDALNEGMPFYWDTEGAADFVDPRAEL